MSDNIIGDFEIIDAGIDHAQYFQIGSGTYDDKVIGVGDNAKEAFEDALLQIDSGENDYFRIKDSPMGISLMTEESDEVEYDEDDDGESELHYYVAIRFNVG